MGHNNSKYQNSLEIEQLKVGWLELTFKIFSFSLYFLIPPSNFKLLYLTQNRFDLQRCFTPFCKTEKQDITF